jgi:hypothetical protein
MMRKTVLVVANVTAASPELEAALLVVAGNRPTAFTLIVPATAAGGDQERLDAALAQLRAAGLEIDGHLADSDPICAISDAWDPRRYDEIVVSTLPMRVSKWLNAGFPKRVADLTGALVTHVVAEPARTATPSTPPPPREKHPLGPLSVLGWGGASDHT